MPVLTVFVFFVTFVVEKICLEKSWRHTRSLIADYSSDKTFIDSLEPLAKLQKTSFRLKTCWNDGILQEALSSVYSVCSVVKN